MWGLKLFVSALSPLLALIGVLTAIVGIVTGSVFIGLIGFFDALIYVMHIISITLPLPSTSNFDKAFGWDWENHIHPEQKARFLPTRTRLRLPAVPNPRLKQNIPFAVIPGTQHELLCDVWQPPPGISSSGVAFIYLHGGAFYMLDKDCGTRPFFSHLASQGHVIMDVAYRLAPETDIMGMVQDAKRAIVWMKEHANTYGVNKDSIMIGGGSAGGHLALLAAYTSDDPGFTPDDLTGKDIGVCGVISLYGTNDLAALYYHTSQDLTTRSVPGRPQKAVPTKMPGWIIKSMGENYHRLGFDKGFENSGALAPLLGGHPDECPERYVLFSPVSHVHPGCPPTLLVQGEHDIMAPVTATRRLYSLLLQNKVPVVIHILPQTDHGFDLALPKISPSAHNAIYDVERFMALMAWHERNAENRINIPDYSATKHAKETPALDGR
jgi:acetyl esterase/lipase